jgi:phosphoenolpyruvate carboxylase
MRRLYESWPYFQGLITNVETSLAVADMRIASYFADHLVEDESIRNRIMARIIEEFEASRTGILAVSGQTYLLERTEYLRRSIELRNPYVDPLSYLQVRFIKELRLALDAHEDQTIHSVSVAPGETASPDPLLDTVLMAINGVAEGLQNTG